MKLRQFFLLLVFLLSSLCGLQSAEECARTVLVSIVPHQYFVERIAGDSVHVIAVVPPGANAHFYEPTPKQVMEQSCAQAWFLVGEAFEQRAAKAVQYYHPKMQLVDLRKNINLIHDSSHGGCSHEHCADSHIWMSPPAVKIQLATILETLIQLYPDQAETFKENYVRFAGEVDALDQEIRAALQQLTHRSFMVSHASYSYYARDYHLDQIPIEFEGKDPSPQQLTRLLQVAREKGVRNVLLQVQFNNKGARLIAEQIGANMTELDPYEKNFFDNMRKTTQSILKP